MLKRYNVICPYCLANVSLEHHFGDSVRFEAVTCNSCDLPFVVRFKVVFETQALSLSAYTENQVQPKKETVGNLPAKYTLKQAFDNLRESADSGPKIDLNKINQTKEENQLEVGSTIKDVWETGFSEFRDDYPPENDEAIEALEHIIEKLRSGYLKVDPDLLSVDRYKGDSGEWEVKGIRLVFR